MMCPMHAHVHSTARKAALRLEGPLAAPPMTIPCQCICICIAIDLSCITLMTIIVCSSNGCGAPLRHATSSQLYHSPMSVKQCRGGVGNSVAQALARKTLPGSLTIPQPQHRGSRWHCRGLCAAAHTGSPC